MSSAADVSAFAERADWPVVLKTARGGYDGKGVRLVADVDEAASVLASWAGSSVLAEELVPFTRELAVVVARSPSGQAATYPVVETVQVDGICREVVAPAPGLQRRACAVGAAGRPGRR